MHLARPFPLPTRRPRASRVRRALAAAAFGGLLAMLGAGAGTPLAVAAVPHRSTPAGAPPSGRATAASPGVVTTTTVTDPDDVDGRFDIAQVTDVVREASRRHVWIAYTVRTFASWVEPRLDRRHRNFVLELNRDHERGSEVNVTVSKRGGHIVAELISNATRQVIRKVRVSRPDDHSFTISGPRRVLGARSYFWTSTFHTVAPGSLCGRRHGHPVTCQDSVPTRGWIRLSRPAWPTRT